MNKAFALLFSLQLLFPVFSKWVNAGEIVLTIDNLSTLVKAEMKKEALRPVYFSIMNEAGEVTSGLVQSADSDQVYTVFMDQKVLESMTWIDLRLYRKGRKKPLAKQVISSNRGAEVDEAIAREAIRSLLEKLKADR